jgi:hypothetical protein
VDSAVAIVRGKSISLLDSQNLSQDDTITFFLVPLMSERLFKSLQ